MKIFSGSSNKQLAEDICKELEIPLGDVFLHEFPSKEKYCQFQTNIRGEDVFLIQSGSNPSNDNLMELMIMIDAAKRASAGRITAVMPYSFYSRQDRKDKSRVPISARLALDMLEVAGANRYLTMDLHVAQEVGFTKLPLDHLYFQTVLGKYISENYVNEIIDQKLSVVAPDLGAIKRGSQFADYLTDSQGAQFSKLIGVDFAFVNKTRESDTKVSYTSFVGNVKGKVVVIIDDMTESCGTMIQAAKICKEQGATKVIAAVSHFCFTEVGMDRLAKTMPHPNVPENNTLYIDEFIHSDTVNLWWSKKYKPTDIRALSVAPLFAKAISRITKNESVSDLF